MLGHSLTVIDAPAEEPVTQAQAKANARVEHTAEDALWAGWVRAARRLVEERTGLRLVTQTLRLTLPHFPCDYHAGRGSAGLIRLPVEPVTAVASVQYVDAAGDLQTLPADEWLTWLDHRPPLVYPAPGKPWPATQTGRLDAVRVTFTAGYGDAGDVPETVRQVIYLVTDYWNRERGGDDAPARLGLPAAAESLLRHLDAGGYR